VQPILDPTRPIIDAHHHLWDRPEDRYLLEEYARDIGTGHNILATVYLQARSGYRPDGPVELRPVGETEFAVRIAEAAETGRYGATRVCAAIVGYADVGLGAGVEAVLEAHLEAGKGRFRGIRTVVAWDPDPELALPYDVGCDRTEDPTYREGVGRLARFGLSLDIALYHTQLHNVPPLAASIPDVPIVVNHVGMPARRGRYADDLDGLFNLWRARIAELAEAPNVYMKLGGLGWPNAGFNFRRETQVDAEILAEAWRPFIEECIARFGAERCLFESDFPVDSWGTDYPTLWNAFKLITGPASEDEKHALYCGTAAALYRIAV